MTDVVEELAGRGIREVVRWVLASRPGDSTNWLGIVQLLTFGISQDGAKFQSHEWNDVERAYDSALARAKEAGDIDQHEVAVRRLNLTSALAHRVPPNPSVRLLNPAEAIELFFRELPLSVTEAGQLSARWRELDIPQIRTLRRVKNLLAPVLAMARYADEDVRAQLGRWEEVFPFLP